MVLSTLHIFFPYHHLINLLLALSLCHFSMANTNSATSHLKALVAGHASKPSTVSHTKATTSCNINLDEDE
jgi:hypothetical protein